MNPAKNADEPTFGQGFVTGLWNNGASIVVAVVVVAAGAAVVAVAVPVAVVTAPVVVGGGVVAAVGAAAYGGYQTGLAAHQLGTGAEVNQLGVATGRQLTPAELGEKAADVTVGGAMIGAGAAGALRVGGRHRRLRERRLRERLVHGGVGCLDERRRVSRVRRAIRLLLTPASQHHMEEKIPTPGRHPLVLRNPGDPLPPDRPAGLGRGAMLQAAGLSRRQSFNHQPTHPNYHLRQFLADHGYFVENQPSNFRAATGKLRNSMAKAGSGLIPER